MVIKPPSGLIDGLYFIWYLISSSMTDADRAARNCLPIIMEMNGLSHITSFPRNRSIVYSKVDTNNCQLFVLFEQKYSYIVT